MYVEDRENPKNKWLMKNGENSDQVEEISAIMDKTNKQKLSA